MKCEGFTQITDLADYLDNNRLIAHYCAYDVTELYDLVKDVYRGEAVIPLNKRNTKDPEKLPAGNPLCDAGLAMHKDGKTSDGHGSLRQKFCCPFRQSKSGCCPCNHRNWNNGKKNRGCTKYKTLPADYRLSIDRESSSRILSLLCGSFCSSLFWDRL